MPQSDRDQVREMLNVAGDYSIQRLLLMFGCKSWPWYQTSIGQSRTPPNQRGLTVVESCQYIELERGEIEGHGGRRASTTGSSRQV